MILGIENRTENWKTAYEFAPMFRDCEARLELARRLGEQRETEPAQVSLELYWKGLRDYLYCKQGAKNEKLTGEIIDSMAQKYVEMFPDLRDSIEKYRAEGRDIRSTFENLNKRGYILGDVETKGKLGDNLLQY